MSLVTSILMVCLQQGKLYFQFLIFLQDFFSKAKDLRVWVAQNLNLISSFDSKTKTILQKKKQRELLFFEIT